MSQSRANHVYSVLLVRSRLNRAELIQANDSILQSRREQVNSLSSHHNGNSPALGAHHGLPPPAERHPRRHVTLDTAQSTVQGVLSGESSCRPLHESRGAAGRPEGRRVRTGHRGAAGRAASRSVEGTEVCIATLHLHTRAVAETCQTYSAGYFASTESEQASPSRSPRLGSNRGPSPDLPRIPAPSPVPSSPSQSAEHLSRLSITNNGGESNGNGVAHTREDSNE